MSDSGSGKNNPGNGSAGCGNSNPAKHDSGWGDDEDNARIFNDPGHGQEQGSATDAHAHSDAQTPTQRLIDIRNSIQQLAIGENEDSTELKKNLSIMVKQLDDVLKSLQFERHQVQWQVQQAQRDVDLERERRRIEPLKPPPPGGPHRIDWKHNLGF
jgi:hypothetical protein